MLLVVAVSAVLAGPAVAEPITFIFTGEVTSVTGEMTAPFQDVQVNDPLELSYVFESTTPDTQLANPAIGSYGAISELQVKIGEAQQSWTITPPLNVITVLSDIDRYAATAGSLPMTTSLVIDFASGTMQDDSLPSTLPWDEVTSTSFALTAGGSVNATVTTWTPEPSALAVLALVSPFALRRRG
jgi:hypothetical protein